MTETALATSAQPLWTLLEEYGLDPELMFRDVGIDPALLRKPNARLPVHASNAIWMRANARISDPCFGLRFGVHWHPSMFGSLGYAWLASTSLRTALNRFVRYTDLVTERGAVDVADDERGDLKVSLYYRGNHFTLPSLADGLLSMVLRMCRINYGDSLNPIRVTLFHSAPADPGPYYEYFRCPVEFDAEQDSFTLARAVADQPLPSANPYLAGLNDQETIRYLSQLRNDRITDRVKAAIIDHLPSGGVTNEVIAKALNLSSRTMQRQLHGEGVSFKDLLDETRRELAEAYLADESISLTEISFMLGFSEPSAFTRAYRRWTGKAPSAARNDTAQAS